MVFLPKRDMRDFGPGRPRLHKKVNHVKLIAPQRAKPYVKHGKNDAADAEALCEAMNRPTMRFVPVKTADQQAALMSIGVNNGWTMVHSKLVRS